MSLEDHKTEIMAALKKQRRGKLKLRNEEEAWNAIKAAVIDIQKERERYDAEALNDPTGKARRDHYDKLIENIEATRTNFSAFRATVMAFQCGEMVFPFKLESAWRKTATMEPPGHPGVPLKQTCGGGLRFPAVSLSADRSPECRRTKTPQSQRAMAERLQPRGFVSSRLLRVCPITLSFRRLHDPNPHRRHHQHYVPQRRRPR